MITEDGRSTREIISRINQAKCAFQSKKNMFISRSIDKKVRKNVFKTYIWSVALYGSKTWTNSPQVKQKKKDSQRSKHGATEDYLE